MLRNGVAFISVLLMLLLTGCSKEPCVTLVKCRTTTEGVEYYYDTNNNYYWKKPNDEVIYPISDVGLQSKPVLVLPLNAANYYLRLIETSRYEGTIYDIKGYIDKLESCGYSYRISESTPTLLDINATNGSGSVRIIYLQDDVVRIYAVDSYGLPQEPPYLNQQESTNEIISCNN